MSETSAERKARIFAICDELNISESMLAAYLGLTVSALKTLSFVKSTRRLERLEKALKIMRDAGVDSKHMLCTLDEPIDIYTAEEDCYTCIHNHVEADAHDSDNSSEYVFDLVVGAAVTIYKAEQKLNELTEKVRGLLE